VRGEITAKPALLRRSLLTAADLRAVRVQGDEVPTTEVEAVVPASGRARRSPEVAEVARGAARLVLVIAGRRPRDPLHAPPRPGVREEVLRVRAVLVLVVPEREHSRIAASEQEVRGRELPARARGAASPVVRAVERVAGDVSGSGNHGIPHLRSRSS